MYQLVQKSIEFYPWSLKNKLYALVAHSAHDTCTNTHYYNLRMRKTQTKHLFLLFLFLFLFSLSGAMIENFPHSFHFFSHECVIQDTNCN